MWPLPQTLLPDPVALGRGIHREDAAAAPLRHALSPMQAILGLILPYLVILFS